MLSDTSEVVVPKTATLHELGLLLSGLGISMEHLEICKISSAWCFNRVQLSYEKWTPLQHATSFIASAPFYVSTDGLLFILRDNSKKERPMTDLELLKFRSVEFEQ